MQNCRAIGQPHLWEIRSFFMFLLLLLLRRESKVNSQFCTGLGVWQLVAVSKKIVLSSSTISVSSITKLHINWKTEHIPGAEQIYAVSKSFKRFIPQTMANSHRKQKQWILKTEINVVFTLVLFAFYLCTNQLTPYVAMFETIKHGSLMYLHFRLF